MPRTVKSFKQTDRNQVNVQWTLQELIRQHGLFNVSVALGNAITTMANESAPLPCPKEGIYPQPSEPV